MSSLFAVQDRSVVDKITQQLAALPLDKDGALVITPQPFGSDVVTAFFANVLQAPSLTIAAPVTRTKTEPTGIVVQGNAGFLGYDGLVFTLTVAWDDDNKQAVLSIDGAFAPDKMVTPPVITWISLGQLGLTAAYQSQLQMVQFAFHGVIISGGADPAHIPFRLAPATGDSWQIGFGGGSVAVSAEQLVGLVSGDALTSFFPPELSNILSAITVSGLDATFDPKSKTVDYFSVGIAVTNGWDIAPKVSLEPGLQLTLTLVNPTDATNRQSIGTVTGTFKLNTTELPLYVQGTSGGGSSLWSFGVQPGESVTLPSFSDLLGLAGGDDFLKSLPPAFSQIPQILINDLMITFDPGKKILTEVTFSIQTKSSWPVVAGYFEVTNIYVKFDITNVNVSANRTVAGLVRSTDTGLAASDHAVHVDRPACRLHPRPSQHGVAQCRGGRDRQPDVAADRSDHRARASRSAHGRPAVQKHPGRRPLFVERSRAGQGKHDHRQQPARQQPERDFFGPGDMACRLFDDDDDQLLSGSDTAAPRRVHLAIPGGARPVAQITLGACNGAAQRTGPAGEDLQLRGDDRCPSDIAVQAWRDGISVQVTTRPLGVEALLPRRRSTVLGWL